MDKAVNHDRMRLTPKGNYHITLVFLGDQDAGQIPEIEKCMQDLADEFTSVPVCCSGVEMFPVRSAPRTMVVPITRGREDIVAMMRYLQRGLSVPMRAGRVVPHVTLGRVRKGVRIDRVALCNRLEQRIDVKFDLNKVVLYRSYLERSGARYIAVRSIRLTT